METIHRKIELQSPSDLSYLTTQLRTAARQKLDLHLPSVTDNAEPDELRKNVEVLVDQFVNEIIRGMRANVAVNGMDVVSSSRAGDDDGESGDAMDGVVEQGAAVEAETVEYEVYDEKLRTQLSSTVAKRDALIARISQHRRETPGVAAEAFRQRFEREGGGLEGFAVVAEEVEEEEGALMVEVKRQEDVQRMWEKAVLGLERLNKGLPETRARLERCGDVVGYLGAGSAGK